MSYLGIKKHNTIFNDIEGFGYIEEDIIKKNIKNATSDKVVNIEKISKVDILSEFNCLLNSIELVNCKLREIIIEDDTAFVMQQHNFLNDYIVIDLKEDILRIITSQEKVFVMNLTKMPITLYGVIFESYSPRKIFVSLKEIYNNKNISNLSINSPYDISHLIKIFYGKQISNIKEITSLFFIGTSDDNDCLLYNLFSLKQKLNDILVRNSLMSLFNKEMSFISLMFKTENLGLPFSNSLYNEFITQIKESLDSTITTLSLQLGEELKGCLNDKNKLLKLFQEKDLFTSLNKDLWSLQGNIEIQALLVALDLEEKYKNYHPKLNNDRLIVGYDLYDDFGNIKQNIDVDGYYVACDEGKVIVTGSYLDLYHRVFAGLSNIDFIINSINENNFISELAMRTLKVDSAASRFNSINILDAYIQGYFDVDEVADYFFYELDTIFDNESMEKLLERFNENSGKLIKSIKKFNRDLSKDKRICIEGVSNLHDYIKMTEADVFKSAVLDVYDDITSFNNSNKYKIKLIGLQNNKVILEADEKALNIGIDILNRKLPKAFDKYVRKVQAICNVTSSSKLK